MFLTPLLRSPLCRAEIQNRLSVPPPTKRTEDSEQVVPTKA